MQILDNLDFGQFVFIALISIVIASLVTLILSVIFTHRKDKTGKLVPSRPVWVAITVAGSVIALGLAAVWVSPEDADGKKELALANSLGAILVALGATVEIYARAMQERSILCHERWHNGGLILLALGGALLALRPIFEVVN